MSLKDEYYEHVLNDVDYGKTKNIVFKLISDATSRRGWRQEWDQFDEDIQEEVFEKWIEIVDSQGE